MTNQTYSQTVWVHLFDGEQDGFRRKIQLKTIKGPKRFYIWHVNDDEKIEAARGRTRMVLQSKLATMAYEKFDEVDPGDGYTELRYRRCESADKIEASPA